MEAGGLVVASSHGHSAPLTSFLYICSSLFFYRFLSDEKERVSAPRSCVWFLAGAGQGRHTEERFVVVIVVVCLTITTRRRGLDRQQAAGAAESAGAPPPRQRRNNLSKDEDGDQENGKKR